MPWLVKDEEKPENNLLFVHIPRCGGTSLSKFFNVEKKSRKGLDPYHKFGNVYFFYRYWLLEQANFPFLSFENLIFLIEYIIAIVLFTTGTSDTAAISLFSTGAFLFLTSTFFVTAPVIGRNWFWRRAYGQVAGKAMCDFIGFEPWLTGCNHKGFLVHFTASKMLKYDFIKEKDLEDSFAITRNPYSRMVSIYNYNRFALGYGCSESFKHFCKDWVHNKMKIYRETGSTEEWDIYCHALPSTEFVAQKDPVTGKYHQIVKCIVKQEELKLLWHKGLTKQSFRHNKRLLEIPDKVASALQGMPHANKRKRPKPWWDYYDQETLNLVYEAYAIDFAFFGYDTALPNRSDLEPPTLSSAAQGIQPFSSNLNFNLYKDGSLKDVARAGNSQKTLAKLGSILEETESCNKNGTKSTNASCRTEASKEADEAILDIMSVDQSAGDDSSSSSSNLNAQDKTKDESAATKEQQSDSSSDGPQTSDNAENLLTIDQEDSAIERQDAAPVGSEGALNEEEEKTSSSTDQGATGVPDNHSEGTIHDEDDEKEEHRIDIN